MKFRIQDTCGYWWQWNGERIFLEDAEAELGEENGYRASTIEEALKIFSQESENFEVI